MIVRREGVCHGVLFVQNVSLMVIIDGNVVNKTEKYQAIMLHALFAEKIMVEAVKVVVSCVVHKCVGSLDFEEYIVLIVVKKGIMDHNVLDRM